MSYIASHQRPRLFVRLVTAVHRRWRLGLSATVAVLTGSFLILGAATAGAAVLITSQAQIGAGAVSGHARTPQSEIMSQSVGQADIGKGGVSGSAGDGKQSEIANGTIAKAQLDPLLVKNLGAQGFSDYTVFTHKLDFGPGGIGGAWCGAPFRNKIDHAWVVVGGGAQLTPDDVDNGVNVVSSWPNLKDPLNPGWNVQLNKPAGYDPGVVTLYAVCGRRQ